MIRRTAIFAGLLAAACALVGYVLTRPKATEPHTRPQPKLEIPVPIDYEAGYHTPLPHPLVRPHLRVLKSAHRLELYSEEKLLRAYPVGLGMNGNGKKRRQWDLCTPEGKYTICAKNPNSKYYLALVLSYPNEADAARALAEGLITRAQCDEIASAIRKGSCPPRNTPLGGDIVIHAGARAPTGRPGASRWTMRTCASSSRGCPWALPWRSSREGGRRAGGPSLPACRYQPSPVHPSSGAAGRHTGALTIDRHRRDEPMGSSLTMLTYTVPYFLIDTAGITYALIQWRRHPRLSALITIALGMSLLRLVAFDVLWPSISHLFGQAGYSYYENAGLRILSMTIGLASYVLLIVAAFYGFQEGSKATGRQ
jgi:hypothetical protein